MEIVAAYIRVSTSLQEDSPETQRAVITRFAARKDLVIPPDLWFIDLVVSAGKPIQEREAGRRLIHQLLDRHRRTFSRVIIVRTDRAFRDHYDQEFTFRLVAKVDAEIVGATQDLSRETAQQRANLATEAVYNQLEREKTGERVKEHNRELHYARKHIGGYPPRGLILPGKDQPFTVDAAALAIVSRVYELFCETGASARQAAARACREGLGDWTATKVMRAVCGPCYRRQQYYAGELIEKPGLIPETIAPALVARVDALLIARYGHWYPRLGTGQAPTKIRTTYSGLIACPLCGHSMALARKYDPPHTEQLRCALSVLTPPACAQGTLHGPTVDWLVGEAVRQWLLLNVAGEKRPAPKPRPAPPSTDDRRRRLLDLYVDGSITDAEYRRQLARIDADAARYAQAEAPAPPFLPFATIRDLLAQWSRIWTPDMRDGPKRELLVGALKVGRGGIVASREPVRPRALRALWRLSISSPIVEEIAIEWEGVPREVSGTL